MDFWATGTLRIQVELVDFQIQTTWKEGGPFSVGGVLLSEVHWGGSKNVSTWRLVSRRSLRALSLERQACSEVVAALRAAGISMRGT